MKHWMNKTNNYFNYLLFSLQSTLSLTYHIIIRLPKYCIISYHRDFLYVWKHEHILCDIIQVKIFLGSPISYNQIRNINHLSSFICMLNQISHRVYFLPSVFYVYCIIRAQYPLWRHIIGDISTVMINNNVSKT